MVLSKTAFQSLFFWIHFYNYRRPPYMIEQGFGFQSLFFWIHFYNPDTLTTRRF